jgi:cytochrome c peroxidase
MSKDRIYTSIVKPTLALPLLLSLSGNALAALDPGEDDYDLKLLGKYVFFDNISNPPRMACVTCHDPETGGTGSTSGVNLHQVAITGANPHTVGNLKPPTNAYASFIDALHPNPLAPIPPYIGGNFWNGRAEGSYPAAVPGGTKHIGEEVFQDTNGQPVSAEAVADYGSYFGPTADQALNPPPNPVEQNTDRISVCQHVASAKYAPLYKAAWGVDIDCSSSNATESAPDVDNQPEKQYDISYKRIMLAVCAWQHSVDLNSFSSKRDKALAADADGHFPLDGLTAQENLGHDLFYGKARCSACHSNNPGDNGEEPEQRYTDSGYHNIGTPKNSEIPKSFDADGIEIDPDLGLMGLTGEEADRDLEKTPTLRNVDKRKGKGFTKAYTHNGWFKSLEAIVHFYNTADVNGATARTFEIIRCPEGIETEKDALANNCWPAPASPDNTAIPFVLGDLELNLDEEAAIVAYLKTLTDDDTATKPKPYKASIK